jgi:site-specific DNA-cytosine methylase
MTRTPERAVCLFAGLGATAHGQMTIGNVLAGAVEYVPTFAESIRSNIRGALVLEDSVKDLNFHSKFGDRVDVVLGGPPCQPFSQANQNTLADADPRDCIPDFVRAVDELRPRLFVMEEVKTLTYAKHADYFAAIIDALRALGYAVDWRVLDMSKFGVPQSRKRLFIVGRNDGEPVAWPTERSHTLNMGHALGWSQDEAERRARQAPGEYAFPAWVFERPSTTVVGTFRPEIQAAPGYRKAGDPPRQRTPGSVAITEAEALVLQGLPADWIVRGSEAQRRLQIGNSCPPTMTGQITLANDKIGA